MDALLAELGTARPSVRREHGPAYERSRPDELWHIDIKGPFFLQRARGEYTKVWIVGLVDDHSRFLIGLRLLPRPQAEPILEWLADCFELVVWMRACSRSSGGRSSSCASGTSERR